MCEECESLHDRSGQPDMVMGQSIVPSEIKTEVPLESDDPAYQNLPLQRFEERIKSLSLENKVSKFMDAGFIHVVEIGQYFMTKDTEEQFFTRACREYTLPRSDESSQPKGWIQGNTKIGPVLEVTTSCLYGKHGVEIRIRSLNKDNTQSWARISHFFFLKHCEPLLPVIKILEQPVATLMQRADYPGRLAGAGRVVSSPANRRVRCPTRN